MNYKKKQKRVKAKKLTPKHIRNKHAKDMRKRLRNKGYKLSAQLICLH